ncbi:Trafficking kinesin-binding protein 1 [Trichinella zimbabwensis]|uniref:Trafficking kinesin-binding protein 1 n=1 Tax=Trichinella zimbabwensis TaxID=268475 RepID=A0A0V1HNC3_9BILA|nr:Trafficking kinesin-binding protein 1 [Trichinella zimbabwensis]
MTVTSDKNYLVNLYQPRVQKHKSFQHLHNEPTVVDKKSYMDEVKEFINSAELSQYNGDHQFEAGNRRLASSSRLPFPKPTPYSASAQQQSACVAKLSNEETMSNYEILRTLDYLLHMAAQVGLILLKRNSELQHTNESLEKKLIEVNKELTELKHELQLKLSLLRALAEEEGDQLMNNPYGSLSYQDLQEKMRNLEEQNPKLQLEGKRHLKCSKIFIIELLSKRYPHSQFKIQNLSEQLSEGKEVCMQQQAFIESLQKEMEQLDLLNSKLREEKNELI